MLVIRDGRVFDHAMRTDGLAAHAEAVVERLGAGNEAAQGTRA